MLNALFRIHGLITLAAGIVLIGWPRAIPATVSIDLTPDAYLLCYLLGAVEVSVAMLSYYGASLTSRPARRLLGLSFVVMHGLTALLEVYAISRGGSAGIWANVALRVIVAILFGYYAVIRQPVT